LGGRAPDQDHPDEGGYGEQVDDGMGEIFEVVEHGGAPFV
jgi:hypothetical protein